MSSTSLDSNKYGYQVKDATKTKADLPPLFFLTMWKMRLSLWQAHPIFFEKYLPTTTITGLCQSVSKGPCQASQGLNTSSNHDSFRNKSKTLFWSVLHVTAVPFQIRWISPSPLESQLWEILNLRLITSHLPKPHGEKSLYTTTERGQNARKNRNRDKKPRETSSHVSPGIQLYPK